MHTELVVKTADPQLLDETVQQLPGCVASVVDGSFDGTTCRLRVHSGLHFLRFAFINQGYGEIVSEEQVCLPEFPGIF